jgi:tetratricopeptide (TPR) repeat protein
MNPEEIYDKIDAYLWELLPPEERTALENDLANNEELRADLALRKLEYEAMRLSSQDNLRAKMKAWKTEAQDSETISEKKIEAKVVKMDKTVEGGRIVKFQPYRWAAAAAILLCAFLFGNYWGKINYSDNALYNQFKGEDSFSGLRGGDMDTVKSYKDAITLIEKGDFNEAISIFEKIEDKTLFEKTQFALGESYIRTKNYANAIKSYQNIMAQSGSPTDVQLAEWKLVLTYLVSGQTKGDFDSLLSKIALDKNHISNKKALDLQQRVGSVWRKIGQ